MPRKRSTKSPERSRSLEDIGNLEEPSSERQGKRLRKRRRGRLPGPTFPGSPAGIENAPHVDIPPEPGAVSIRCIDYGPERASIADIEDLEAFLAQPRPKWAKVRWIDVAGLHPQIINRFRQHYGFHTLAAEDALHVPQRPRVEPYPDYLFIVASLFRQEGDKLRTGQVSIFFYGDILLSFREEHIDDGWAMVRQRISVPGSNLRQADGGFLLYSLLDITIDHLFPVVEHFGDILESLEERILDDPSPELSRDLHSVRRKLLDLRRIIWPMRLMIHDLQSGAFPNLSSKARTYLRDVHEHAVQLIDVVETYRDMTSGMIELYLSAISYRMNEVMKVLTIIATIFIPITFLAGVYGMNFEVMPELRWGWGYALFWIICAIIVIGLLRYFRRKGWLG